MRRTPALLAAAALAALSLTACASNATKTAAPAASKASFPATAGGITVAAKPTHIVSLSATATDMLFAAGAGSQVVAVDTNSDYPSNAPKGTLDSYKPNVEAIAADNPDLVVISDDENKIKESLTALKVPVYVAPAAVTIADTYQQMTDLGTLTGNVSGAAAAIATEKSAISQALAGLHSQATPLTYYYELDNTYYSVTSKTFIGSLFAMAHMTNIADPSDASGKAGGYPQLSAETIIKANPDLIFLADDQCCKQSATTVAARPGWSTLKAVQQSHVIAIPDDVASQWGTRVPQLVTAIVGASNSITAS
ncbi:MAG TPA: ABC transporter substrate-binding protein [Micromonosporaceae bacterium]